MVKAEFAAMETNANAAETSKELSCFKYCFISEFIVYLLANFKAALCQLVA